MPVYVYIYVQVYAVPAVPCFAHHLSTDSTVIVTYRADEVNAAHQHQTRQILGQMFENLK